MTVQPTRDQLRALALREDANEHQPDNHGPDRCGDPECFTTCVVDGCDWPCATAWLLDQLDQAEARLRAIRDLHHPWGDTLTHTTICDSCDDAYPCPTVRALESDRTPSA